MIKLLNSWDPCPVSRKDWLINSTGPSLIAIWRREAWCISRLHPIINFWLISAIYSSTKEESNWLYSLNSNLDRNHAIKNYGFLTSNSPSMLKNPLIRIQMGVRWKSTQCNADWEIWAILRVLKLIYRLVSVCR